LIQIIEKLGVKNYTNATLAQRNKKKSKRIKIKRPPKEHFLAQQIIDHMITFLINVDMSADEAFSNFFTKACTKQGIKKTDEAYKLFTKVLTKLGFDPKQFEPTK